MELLRPSAVADYLGMSEESLAQMRYLGQGPRFVKLNSKQVRYRREDVDEWLESRLSGGGRRDNR